MMKKSMSKTNVHYTIDLTQIDGDGSFPCPKCGSVISPEDETEAVYKIVGTKVVNDELVELVINCNECRSNMKLTGFQQAIEGLASK
jgi:transcription initiation factor IIE alpha subunit